MNYFDRILLAFYSLCLIIILFAVGLAVAGWTTPLDLLRMSLVHTNERFILEGIIVVFLVISVKFFLQSLLYEKQPAQALVKDTEMGQVRISVEAIEGMVKRVAGQVSGVSDVKPRVRWQKEGLSIFIRVLLQPATNIPVSSDEIQDKVGEYIAQVAGIRVQSIKILVDGVSADKSSGVSRRLN